MAAIPSVARCQTTISSNSATETLKPRRRESFMLRTHCRRSFNECANSRRSSTVRTATGMMSEYVPDSWSVAQTFEAACLRPSARFVPRSFFLPGKQQSRDEKLPTTSACVVASQIFGGKLHVSRYWNCSFSCMDWWVPDISCHQFFHSHSVNSCNHRDRLSLSAWLQITIQPSLTSGQKCNSRKCRGEDEGSRIARIRWSGPVVL